MAKDSDANKILEEFLDFMKPNRYGSGWTLINSTIDFVLFEKTNPKAKLSIKIQPDGKLYPTGDPEGMSKFRQFLGKSGRKGDAKIHGAGSALSGFLSKRVGKWVVVAAIILMIAWIGNLNGNNNTNTASTTPSAVVANTSQGNTNTSSITKEQAQSELDDLMSLSKKGDLITSYEFSDTASVVYAGSSWYTQTVQFKKDFMGKVAMLKETITGYHHFEVHDALSDEKVGEVTAFSGSINVYK